MEAPLLRKCCIAICLFTLFVTVPRVEADVIAVGVDAFGPGSTLTTFTGLPNQTEVNGLTVDGILYTYSGGNNHVDIGSGPSTSNVQPPSMRWIFMGPDTGFLTLTFPSFMSTFGFDYALGTPNPPGFANRVELFNGSTNVGSLVFDPQPGVDHAGGFAGIQSTIPFNSATVMFFESANPGWAMDNVRTLAIHEPSSLLLLAAGLSTVFCVRKRN
jgi:hypothetical protein